jgi:hypothetical protein
MHKYRNVQNLTFNGILTAALEINHNGSVVEAFAPDRLGGRQLAQVAAIRHSQTSY